MLWRGGVVVDQCNTIGLFGLAVAPAHFKNFRCHTTPKETDGCCAQHNEWKRHIERKNRHKAGRSDGPQHIVLKGA